MNEFILRSVFVISRSQFYFTPDASFDPSNPFNSKLEDVKLTCRLTPSHEPDFKFSTQDFPAIVDNLRKFEKLIERQPDSQVLSVIDSISGVQTIKLSHLLFTKKKFDENGNEIELDDNESQTNSADGGSINSDPKLRHEFDINDWPVSDRCKSKLAELAAADTHYIQPLHAFDINTNLISPCDYEQKLRGATVLVAFAFSHRYIKKSKHHVFSALLRELIVLRPPPSSGPSSPYKRRKLNKSIMSDRKGKRVDLGKA